MSTTPADQTGASVDCFPAHAAFPESQAGRHPHHHFRGLLRLHSRYGPLDRSTAQGGLCHEASNRLVTQPIRSSATRSIDNSLGGTYLHWCYAPSGRTEISGSGSQVPPHCYPRAPTRRAGFLRRKLPAHSYCPGQVVVWPSSMTLTAGFQKRNHDDRFPTCLSMQASYWGTGAQELNSLFKRKPKPQQPEFDENRAYKQQIVSKFCSILLNSDALAVPFRPPSETHRTTSR